MKIFNTTKKWLAVLCSTGLIAVLLMSASCHKVTITNAPPGVVNTEVAIWYQATGAVKAWSDTSFQLTKIAVELHSDFPSEKAYQATLTGLGKENQLGLQATYFLQKSPNAFNSVAQSGLSDYLNQGLQFLTFATDSGLSQIKDANKKAEIDAIVAVLRASLTTIFALTHSTGTPLPAVLRK